MATVEDGRFRPNGLGYALLVDFGLAEYLKLVREMLGERALFVLVSSVYVGCISFFATILLQLYGALIAPFPEGGWVGRTIRLIAYASFMLTVNWGIYKYFRRKIDHAIDDLLDKRKEVITQQMKVNESMQVFREKSKELMAQYKEVGEAREWIMERFDELNDKLRNE